MPGQTAPDTLIRRVMGILVAASGARCTSRAPAVPATIETHCTSRRQGCRRERRRPVSSS